MINTFFFKCNCLKCYKLVNMIHPRELAQKHSKLCTMLQGLHLVAQKHPGLAWPGLLAHAHTLDQAGSMTACGAHSTADWSCTPLGQAGSVPPHAASQSSARSPTCSYGAGQPMACGSHQQCCEPHVLAQSQPVLGGQHMQAGQPGWLHATMISPWDTAGAACRWGALPVMAANTLRAWHLLLWLAPVVTAGAAYDGVRGSVAGGPIPSTPPVGRSSPPYSPAVQSCTTTLGTCT